MHWPKIISLAGLLLASAAGPSAAGPTAGGAEEMTGERLFVPFPKGWTMGYHERKGTIEVTELVPPGQTVGDWQEMLTVQMMDGPAKGSGPDLLKERAEMIRQGCDDVGAGPPAVSKENGYETALRAVACTRSKQWGKGELTLFKAVLGKERTYIVSRSWRGEPFAKDNLPVPADTTKEWLNFMQRVVLCDTRDPERRCPKNEGEGEKKN